MVLERSEDISRLLIAWSNGDEEALNELICVVYPELREEDPDSTSGAIPGYRAQSAALANEAYLKLIRARASRAADDEALLGTRARGVQVLPLDDALSSLSKVDPRKGRVVELRYFGGLSVEETAQVLRDLTLNGIARPENGVALS